MPVSVESMPQKKEICSVFGGDLGEPVQHTECTTVWSFAYGQIRDRHHSINSINQRLPYLQTHLAAVVIKSMLRIASIITQVSTV